MASNLLQVCTKLVWNDFQFDVTGTVTWIWFLPTDIWRFYFPSIWITLAKLFPSLPLRIWRWACYWKWKRMNEKWYLINNISLTHSKHQRSRPSLALMAAKSVNSSFEVIPHSEALCGKEKNCWPSDILHVAIFFPSSSNWCRPILPLPVDRRYVLLLQTSL